ncbi:hypothetical protein KAH94_00960 [bacterium]|nr:hypothetical protein [bacterium]
MKLKKTTSTTLCLCAIIFFSCGTVAASEEKANSSYFGMLGNFIKKNVWTNKVKASTGFGLGFVGTLLFGKLVSKKVRRVCGVPHVGLFQCLFGGGLGVGVMLMPKFKKIFSQVDEIEKTTKNTNDKVMKLQVNINGNFDKVSNNFKCLNEKIDNAHISLAEGISMVDKNVLDLTRVVNAGFEKGNKKAQEMLKKMNALHSGQADIIGKIEQVGKSVEQGNTINSMNAKVLHKGNTKVTQYLRTNFENNNKLHFGNVTFEEI